MTRPVLQVVWWDSVCPTTRTSVSWASLAPHPSANRSWRGISGSHYSLNLNVWWNIMLLLLSRDFLLQLCAQQPEEGFSGAGGEVATHHLRWLRHGQGGSHGERERAGGPLMVLLGDYHHVSDETISQLIQVHLKFGIIDQHLWFQVVKCPDLLFSMVWIEYVFVCTFFFSNKIKDITFLSNFIF